jgi:hypothetical protein
MFVSGSQQIEIVGPKVAELPQGLQHEQINRMRGDCDGFQQHSHQKKPADQLNIPTTAQA